MSHDRSSLGSAAQFPPSQQGAGVLKRFAYTSIAAALCFGSAAAMAATDYKDIGMTKDINGRSLLSFVSSECGGCHNPKRTGATGPNITMKRLREGNPKAKDRFKYPIDEETIFYTVKNGRPGTVMPAWGADTNPIGKALTDAQMKAIAHYLYNNPAPKRFEWSLAQMKKSLTVLTKKLGPVKVKNTDELNLVTEREAFDVAVINSKTLKVIARLPSGARAHGYTFSNDGNYAYNLGRDGWLYKYNLHTLQAERKIRLGLDARGIAISDDDKYVLTGMYIPTQAVIVDAHTLKPLKIFDTHHVKNPDGKYVDSRICSVNDVSPKKVGPYFLMALKEGGQVWRINYAKKGFPVTKVANVGQILHDGFLREDNKVFFLASQSSNWMAAIDVAKMKVLAKMKTGKKPHPGEGAVWTSGGHEYAATTHIGEGKIAVWDTHTFKIVGDIPTDAPGLFSRTADNMKYVWSDSVFPPKPNEMTVFEKAPPFKVVKRIMDGTQTLHAEPDATGKYVFVSDWKEGVVRVYDDASLKLVKTIKGFKTPTGIFCVARRHETGGH